MSLLALDIGGTAVKYGFFGKNERFGSFSVKDPNGQERLPDRLLDFILKNPADRIGICTPGPFDFNTGTSLMTHKLPSLYGISLLKRIQDACPNTPAFFIHDSTAFIFGEIWQDHALADKNIAGVMLGTGLGYIHAPFGRAEVNPQKTPLHPLWNMSYKNEIAEAYVSATAILKATRALGYSFVGVKEAALAARNGEERLLSVFNDTGALLGDMINFKASEDGFDYLIIGGQVSGAWDLMRSGFESVCSLPHRLTNDPAKCALYGIRYCIERGIDDIYI